VVNAQADTIASPFEIVPVTLKGMLHGVGAQFLWNAELHHRAPMSVPLRSSFYRVNM
jgi:hypothetical protein